MGKHSYAVVFDAGSSGTRVYVYRWDTAEHARKDGDDEDLQSLPEVKTKSSWNKKVKPGISTFGEKPEDVGHDHLRELVEFASDIVGKDEIENTPIFLLATAGMRLLPDHQRQAVLEQTCAYFQQNTAFQLPDCDLHVQVIPGETEGLYGWIAANYLLKAFDAPESNGPKRPNYGFLDMGGASAQIAFAPNATEAEKHANDLTLLRLRTVGGEAQEYRVFVTTWLGFGANEARRRYVEHLLEASPTAHELPDPCLPVGITITKTGDVLRPGSKELLANEAHLLGTGDFAQCLKATYPLLEKEKECTDAPCLLNGQHTPSIDFDVNHFVGVSEYWHTTHGVFAKANKNKAYDLQTYQQQVTDFCSQSWVDIENGLAKEAWGHKVDEKTVEEVCFKASWLINMLYDGIGVPRLGIEAPHTDGSNKTSDLVNGAKDKGFVESFRPVDTIDNEEVSWTLGKAVLYASSQMPPAAGALAVGFGSNTQGSNLPDDFQSPGGSQKTASGSASTQDWHDRILTGSYGRRVPGILIFLLILFVCGLLICGRERRMTIYHKILSWAGGKPGAPRPKLKKRPGLLGGKLFGNGSPTYERVLEDGDPAEFELADVSDDDRNSDSSPVDAIRSGRTSGMVTPALRALSPDFSRGSPKQKNYFDMPAASAPGLGITPFERGGRISRSESKETLASASNRSRKPSPTRKMPLITPVKESVD